MEDVTLRPVLPTDLEELYLWSTQVDSAYRWRFGGATPTPEQFREAMLGGVLCQFIVESPGRQRRGLVVCYGHDHVNGTAYVAVQGNPADRSGVGAMVGFVKLIDHVFTHWPMRRLYVEVPEYNRSQFRRGLERHLVCEARYQEKVFHGGRYWDETVWTMTRQMFTDTARPKFAALLPKIDPGESKDRGDERDVEA